MFSLLQSGTVFLSINKLHISEVYLWKIHFRLRSVAVLVEKRPTTIG